MLHRRMSTSASANSAPGSNNGDGGAASVQSNVATGGSPDTRKGEVTEEENKEGTD